MATIPASTIPMEGFQVNRPPASFDPQHDLPQGFLEFLEPLHRRFAPWQRSLIEERKEILAESHQGERPVHRFPGRRRAARLANRIAGMVPGPAQPDDGSGRRCRPGGEDA